MPIPLSPDPVEELVHGRLPPHLSNGVIGVRFASLPHLAGTAMVSGFAGLSPQDGVEGFARAPYIMAIDVALIGVWASNAPEWVELLNQRYDFAAGELLTRWRFRSRGSSAIVETVALCPRSVPGLAAIEVTVTVEKRPTFSFRRVWTLRACHGRATQPGRARVLGSSSTCAAPGMAPDRGRAGLDSATGLLTRSTFGGRTRYRRPIRVDRRP